MYDHDIALRELDTAHRDLFDLPQMHAIDLAFYSMHTAKPITNLPNVRYDLRRYLAHVGAIFLTHPSISLNSLLLSNKKKNEHTSPSSRM